MSNYKGMMGGINPHSNKVDAGTSGKAMQSNQVPCSMPKDTTPKKGAQTSGAVKHARSGKKVENMANMPKNYPK